MDNGVAIAAIFSSGVVGLGGVIGPAFTHHIGLREARRVRVRDQRAEAYTAMLRLMTQVLAGESEWRPIAEEGSILAWLWGSEEVRQLFFAWIKIVPTRYGPEATDESKRRVTEAANAVRRRMGEEVQGKVKP